MVEQTYLNPTYEQVFCNLYIETTVWTEKYTSYKYCILNEKGNYIHQVSTDHLWENMTFEDFIKENLHTLNRYGKKEIWQLWNSYCTSKKEIQWRPLNELPEDNMLQSMPDFSAGYHGFVL